MVRTGIRKPVIHTSILVSGMCAAMVVLAAWPAAAVPRESHEEKEANLRQQAKGGLFHKWTFDADAVNALPGGFSPLSGDAITSPPVWTVIPDATAPSAPQVVAVTSSCEGEACFRLLVADGLAYEYPDLSVRFRSAAGLAGVGGMAFGVKDAKNFYAALVDAEARSAQVIKMVDGVATVLGKTAVTLKAIEWHSLRVQRNTIISKDFIEAFVDGVLVLSVEDQDLGAGQVGFVTQGKTSLYFDTFHAVPLFSHRPLSAPAAY
ncbi:MAG: hypothetical protein RI101_02760 [Nitrospira sp.]|jgi:hypothetical protein|nr:hypothetical protein [Nitrospira sp.]